MSGTARRRGAAVPGRTTAAGLGTQHQRRRAEALALLSDGDRCWRCKRPMFTSAYTALRAGYPASYAVLDLDHVRSRSLGGADGPTVLAHASCNRSAGAKLGNQLQHRRKRRSHSRW